MIDYDLQLKLQAYLDQELSPADARRVEQCLAGDAEAQALLAELTATRTALADFESEVRLPESREFFWSKIQREIEREARPAPAGALAWGWWSGWRRWLAPAGALAVVASLALVLGRPGHLAAAEAEMADTGAFTYHDFAARTTLVWLSFPAEKELADNDGSDTME